ncbi:MAG: C1q-like domain-containing protein, partial [Dolichospermum sp.]
NGTNESLLSFSNSGTGRGYIFNNTSGQTYWTEGSRNMEFYIAGAGFMGFGTNNAERMRITSGGEVGIGLTPTSGNRFWIKGSDSTSGNTSLLVQNSSNAWLLYVRNDGNVGIGTSNPLCRLHIGPEGSVGGNTPTMLISSAAGTKPAILITEYTARSGAFGYDSSNFLTLATEASVTAGIKFKVGSSFQSGLLNTGTDAMVINGSGQILTPAQPAFLAYGNGNGSFNTVVGDYLIYPAVSFNRGNHYNASNGIFTAPIAGVYHFSWSTIGGNDNEVYRSFLRINNNTFLGDYHLRQDTGATGAEYGTNGNRSALVNLAANDQVRIFFKTDTNNSMYGRGATSDPYHNFMGHLIG